MRLRKTLFAGGAVAGIVLGTANISTASPSSGNGTANLIRGAGSDTTYLAMAALSNAYNATQGCTLFTATFPHNPANPEQTCRPTGQPANVVTTENYDHDVATSFFPQGSSDGRRQLCAQQTVANTTATTAAPSTTTPFNVAKPATQRFVEYARSSSNSATGFQCNQKGLTLRFVAFARDALTWTTFPGGASAGVTNLTVSQLTGIFSDCTITTWGQVKGTSDPTPIVTWTAIAASGSRATWDGFLGTGENSDLCIPGQYKDGNQANGERVIREHFQLPVINGNDASDANEGNSIFFGSVGVLNTNADAKQTATLGSIEGFAPTPANIQSSDFPFTRSLFNVIRQASTSGDPSAAPWTRDFVGNNGWICKGEAAHSEPVGTAGPGIETVGADEDYGARVTQVINANGFFPELDPTVGNACTFTDVAVNP